MRVVILAAGSSTRMLKSGVAGHKSLIEWTAGETFIERLMHQCMEYGLRDITVVTGGYNDEVRAACSRTGIQYTEIYNDRYKDDKNSLSLLLALERGQSDDVLILESDLFISDYSFYQLSTSFQCSKTVWFNKGQISLNQNGGYIISNKLNNEVEEIGVSRSFEGLVHKENIFKMTGVMIVSKPSIQLLEEHLKNIDFKTNYYLRPFLDNKIPLGITKLIDKVYSFNTKIELDEFYQSIERNVHQTNRLEYISNLREIEETVIERVPVIIDKLKKDQFWIKRIVVEESGLILDGHHRIAAAKTLGLKKVPVVVVKYEDIPVWSLRSDFELTPNKIQNSIKSGYVYPNKTCKHDFFGIDTRCNYELKSLI
jgi:L-serine kinase (ADP)